MVGTRKIAAILFADIVGYSGLAGADEDRTPSSPPRGLRSDLIARANEAHPCCDVSVGTNRKTQNQREERMRLNRRFVNVGLAASPWWRLRSPASLCAGGDTVKIGMVLSVTGPGADGGKYALAGYQDRAARSGQQGGRRARQTSRTHHRGRQTTNPGAVLAFSKLAVQPDIVAFLGEIRSTQNHAMATWISVKTGKPVCFGGTDPKLDEDGQSLG